MKYEQITVSCYSGSSSNERPVSFTHRGEQYEVEAILDRWYEGGLDPRSPVLRYFKVLTTRGSECMLRYNAPFDAWAILVHE